MKKKESFLFLILIMMALFCLGCAPVMAGALFGTGTYAFATGSVEESYEAGLHETYEAVLVSLEEMGVTITEESYDSFEGIIRAESPHAGKIYVELTPLAEDVTEVKVHIGPFGNEHQSLMIHRALAEELGFRRDLVAIPEEEVEVEEAVTVLVVEEEKEDSSYISGTTVVIQPPQPAPSNRVDSQPREETVEEETDLYRPHPGGTVVIIDGERVIVPND